MNPDIVSTSGATDLVANVSKATGGNQTLINTVLWIYNKSITNSFYVAVVMGALTIIPVLGVEWKSVKEKPKSNMDADEASNAEDGTPKDPEKTDTSEDHESV